MIGPQRPADPEYWAASQDLDRLGSALWEKKQQYFEHLRATGRLSLVRRVYDAYFRGFIDSGMMHEGGEEGELALISINHLRNLITHICVMTTAQRPAPEPKATNTDTVSQQQTILASGLLEFKQREKRLERLWYSCVEQACTGGEGWISVAWDQYAGPRFGVDPTSGQVKHQGDCNIGVFGILDVIRDFRIPNGGEHSWYITREWANRYDLMARYPELADKIANVTSKMNDPENPRLWEFRDDEAGDVISLFKFYHADTDAVAGGRYVSFLDADLVLEAGQLPYKRPHVYRISGGDHLGTSFGYSIAFELLAPQYVVDGLYSTITSNQRAFGVQNIMVPQGSGITASKLTGGLNIIEIKPGAMEPKALNLVGTSPETFKFLEMVEHTMETLSAVNSVARGDPSGALKGASGAAMALIQASALQFNNGLQESYIHLLEDTYTGILDVFKRYGQTETTLALEGKANRPYSKAFTPAQDLAQIDRVTVDVGTAFSRSAAGRQTIAENLLQHGMVKTPDEFFQLMDSGKIEPLLEAPRAEMLNIRAENEDMSEGKPAITLITDNHPKHIQEHLVGLDSPEARSNPQLAGVFLQHIQEHLNYWQQLTMTNPGMLAVRQIPPFPMPMAPPGLPGPPGSAGPGGPPPPGAPAPNEGPPGPASSPGERAGGLPDMPQMPVNPMTGQPANVPGAEPLPG